MTVPAYVKGQYFDVAVDPDGDGQFTTICGLNSRNFTQAFQTGDEYIRDCADPTQVPFRVVNVTGQSFTIAGTGVYNRAQGDLIRNLGGHSCRYRYIMGEDASDAVDSGYYEGNFVLTNVQIGAPDGANVTAQMTFESDGQVVFVPGASIVILDILDMNPKNPVHGQTWTGTVVGVTTGSTLAATSADGTALTVSGTGNTRTVSGNFTNAGNKAVTFVETLAAARNSPRRTSVTVVAS